MIDWQFFNHELESLQQKGTIMTHNFLRSFIVILIIYLSPLCYAAPIFEVPSSFNPVGSGGRALGMAGAYIGSADDGTAASYNPAGLLRLEDYEFAVVFSHVNRRENNTFTISPRSSGGHSISESDINYLSAALIFECYGLNMAFSMSYQYLYDLTRDWSFINENYPTSTIYSIDNWIYQQNGGLSAIGLAYGVQLSKEFSLGITCNFWDNSLSENKWEQIYHRKGLLVNGTFRLPSEADYTESYTFKGFNCNIGFMFKLKHNLLIGGVLKTPFSATVDYERLGRSVKYAYGQTIVDPIHAKEDLTLDMPMSYGIGLLYTLWDKWSISGDIYCTRWDHFVLRDSEGFEYYPITGKRVDESNVDETYQIRLGTEYLFQNQASIISLRGGLFYDPAPAETHPDDFWGISLGIGYCTKHRFSFDLAYQFRTGHNVGTGGLAHRGFSQNVYEHTVYVSFLNYYFPYSR